MDPTRVIQGLLSDYVRLLEKEGHATAAELAQANANLAMRQLVPGESSRKPPEGDSASHRD